MKRTTLMLAALALLLGGVGPAMADLYTFTYTDAYGDSGKVTLTTQSSGLGDGSQWATSGTLNLTSTPYDSNFSAGTYTLLNYGPTAVSVPVFTLTSGTYIDNLVYPLQNAANNTDPNTTPVSNPSYLTYNGLLFGPPGTGSQDFVNIYGTGEGAYGLYTLTGNTTSINAGGGTFTLTAAVVPEPSGIALLGLGVVCLAIGYAVRRRKPALVAA